MPKHRLARSLARAFLAGELTFDTVVARSRQMLGRSSKWLRALAQCYVDSADNRIRPRLREVERFIHLDRGFEKALSANSQEVSVKHYLVESQRMQPIAAARVWNVPVIETVAALADWLWLEYGELEWFADPKGLQSKSHEERLRHYRYRIWRKRSGGVRLIEAPKTRLRKAQREILAGILDNFPAHAAAHGFVKGRSIKTFATPHVGKHVVLRMDLQDFFASIGRARIQTVFRMLGYPESVADRLGAICANVVPSDIWKDSELGPRELAEVRDWYARPHLPQGAPTSPALANMCTYRVDCRLSGLAKAAGADYTRYADDLAFSGSETFVRGAERFAISVAAILREEGLRVNHRKTRIMHQGVRQKLAGLVVNQHIDPIRSDFDRVKATLTNCVRLGPESQNRNNHANFRAHLEGKIAFVEMVNAAKGKRLRSIFEQVDW